MSRPSLAVTIAQWGKTEFTDRCVDSLVRSEYGGSMEILVRDNASDGGPGPIAGRSDVHLVRGETNIGFGPAHDELAELASSELLLILNNDTVLTPTALARMVDTLEADPAIGAVGPRYLDFAGATLEMGGFVGRGGQAWQFLRGMDPHPTFTARPFDVDYVSGACLLLRREAFLDLGGFDDAYAPAYYEDTDLCFKLRRQGLRTVVEPRATVFHYEGGTAGREVSSGPKQLQVDHQTVFAERWADELRDAPPMSSAYALSRALGLDDRPSVLWLAPEMPRPDREAGAARLVAMLHALRASGAAVVLWTESAPEFERYGPILDRHGIPYLFGTSSLRHGLDGDPAGFPIAELAGLHDWTTIVVSFPEMADRFMASLRTWAPGTPIAVDAVDLHYLRESRAGDSDPDEVSALKTWELGVYRAADGVVTASVAEVEELTRELPETPARSFESVATVEARGRSLGSGDGPVVFLGNMNHPPNEDAIAHWVAEIAPHLTEPVPLRIYGTASDRLEGRWEGIEIGGWVEELADVFTGAAVFVAPLTYGAGTKGKLVEAAAAGIPIVTTSIGAEGFEGPLAEAMIVVDEPPKFAAAVERLLSDSDRWRHVADELLAAQATWYVGAEARRQEWARWLLERTALGWHKGTDEA